MRHITGRPNTKQQQFFDSRARYTAYGGARGGGKSWALRRKLIGLCLRYPGIKCLIVRRSYPELKANHLRPFIAEYGSELIAYSESEKLITLPNQSTIAFGYCSSASDTLRYQGQEFDIIAIDEATQLSEYQFSIFKACLRGCNDFPKRMYLTCNPGGVGHAWVKRLFVDREFRAGEHPEDHLFIKALVYDNEVLSEKDPEYVRQLESLSPTLKDAWLYGRWDIFEGQFFPEFDPERHVFSCLREDTYGLRYFLAFDYGFDMTAALLLGEKPNGYLIVLDEFCRSGLTLSQAATHIASLGSGYPLEYAVASPDLWNRRQDSGRSGFEIMQSTSGMPPMLAADDRRIPGWRLLREYLSKNGDRKLMIHSGCHELIHSLPSLMFDSEHSEDASDHPHSVTHAPEALRYAVMSRSAPHHIDTADTPSHDFRFRSRSEDDFWSRLEL